MIRVPPNFPLALAWIVLGFAAGMDAIFAVVVWRILSWAL